LKLAIELRGTIPPPIPDTPPKIAQRIGIDLAPVSAGDPDGVAWLEALIWPEHHERREQLQAALAIAQNIPMRMVAGDATKLLAGVVESIPPEQVPCIFQTHTLNQFSFESRTQLMKTLNELGSKRELLFISRENRLALDHYRAGAKDVMLLAECDAHGKWIEWKAQPSAEPDLEQLAQRAVAKMERGWAESAAIIERHFDDAGDEPRWESTDTHSPTLRERGADAVIEQRGPGLYRMISIWHAVKMSNGRYDLGALAPTRSLEFYRGGDTTVRPTGGLWRCLSLPSPTGPSLGKAGRWEDLAVALRLLRPAAPGIYRVISVRRMLRAERVKGRLRIVKKHAGGESLPCLAPVEQTAPAKKEWSVETLPEHRKSHKITKWKPIMDAAYVGDAEKIAKLLDAGADPNVISTTPHRYRPLHRAIEHKKTAPKHEGHERVVATLLERGADPKQRATMSSLTALQLAAMGEPRFVPMLIDRFRPLDLFHAAVLLDDRKVSELLKNEPKLANSRDANNFTALHYAAASVLFKTNDEALRSQLRIVRQLLAAGADPSATHMWQDKWPIPVMFYSAGAHDNPAVTKLLLEVGATPFDNESIYHASDEGHQQCLDLFENMCDAKKLATECTKCLVSQLHWGHTNGMSWLLAHGANPNAIHPRYGESALHAAIRSKRSEAVLRELFKHGADVKVKTGEGKTAIQLARAAGAGVLRKLEAAGSG
jgi:ankyrin repeat protein